MRSIRIPLRGVPILLRCMTVMASTIPTTEMFARHETPQCPVANWDRCPQNAANHWPDNFCCENGSTCLSNAGNTTLICCPAESNCTVITPMPCGIDLYNADLHPDAMVKTTALNGIMTGCGTDTCCPFGYHCGPDKNGAPVCFLDKDQNPLPSMTTPAGPSATPSGSGSSSPSVATTTGRAIQSTSIAPTPASSPTTASTPGQNNGASSGADTTGSPTPQTAPTGTPPSVIAGASVGAALLVAAVAFIAFIFFKRRHKRQEDEAERAVKLGARSTSSFGNIISNPIVAANTTMRSDFGRKSPGRSSVGSRFSASTLAADDEALPVTRTTVTTPSRPGRRMREGVGTTGARIPPIRHMAQARQSSIAYGVGAPDTSPYSGGHYHAASGQAEEEEGRPYRVTPRQGGHFQEREPSSISINVFADPRIATPQRAEVVGGAAPVTPDMRRNSHMTTFSDMMRVADLGDVAQGKPFVPGSESGTPSSRRR